MISTIPISSYINSLLNDNDNLYHNKSQYYIYANHQAIILI